MDPAQTNGSPIGSQWLNLIYDNLVREGPGGSPMPGLATAWSFPDPQTILLTLRTGVKFQNGTQFNAAAVQFSLMRTLNSGNPQLDKAFSSLSSVEVVDDRTARIHLSAPVAAGFFADLSLQPTMIVSPSAVRSEGSSFAQHPVGAGPYRLTNFTADQTVHVRKFRQSWDSANWKLGGVDWIEVQVSGPQGVNGIASGQIDVTRATDVNTALALKRTPEVTVLTAASLASMEHLDLCATRPPLDKIAVRQAIAYAIDRHALNQGAEGGQAVVSDQAQPPASPNYAPDLGNRYPHNVAMAKQLLKRAGFSNGISFDLTYPNFTAFAKPAEILQSELAAAGINVNLMPANDYVTDELVNMKYPAAVVQTIYPGVAGMTPIAKSLGVYGSFCNYDKPAVDSAIASLQATADPTRTKAAWHAIAQALASDLPMLVLYFNPVQIAFNHAHVGGVSYLFSSAGEGMNLRGVYIKK
jgi:ABC-type transport system substrate-binding protein